MKNIIDFILLQLNEGLLDKKAELFLFNGVNTYFSYVNKKFIDKRINIGGYPFDVCFILDKDDIKDVLKNVHEQDDVMRDWFILYPLFKFNNNNISILIKDIKLHSLDYVINKYKLERIRDPKTVV